MCGGGRWREGGGGDNLRLARVGIGLDITITARLDAASGRPRCVSRLGFSLSSRHAKGGTRDGGLSPGVL